MKPTLPLGILILAATGCASSQPELQIRAAQSSPQAENVAQAETQLALGNVGTALEGFRTVIRYEPGNVRALTGIAHSYERMGRFDLTRRWYEMALAVAPENTSVLTDFAKSLDVQGNPTEAAALRAEAASIAQGNPPGSVTVALPQLSTTAAVRAAESVTVALPAPQPTSGSLAQQSGPRLERLNLAEVALITRSEPVWEGLLVSRTKQSATYRFVPMPPTAKLLNAARYQGLAARTRERLLERGWKRIEIGDAPAIRQKTLVLYPSSQQLKAKKLATQFGFSELRRFDGQSIVVLLGRDTAQVKSLRPA